MYGVVASYPDAYEGVVKASPLAYHALKGASAIEYHGAKPCRMAARAQDGQISFVPILVKKRPGL